MQDETAKENEKGFTWGWYDTVFSIIVVIAGLFITWWIYNPDDFAIKLRYYIPH